MSAPVMACDHGVTGEGRTPEQESAISAMVWYPTVANDCGSSVTAITFMRTNRRNHPKLPNRP